MPDDLVEITELAKTVSARLIIFDPLVAHLPMGIDSHKYQHVTRALTPLRRLAEDRNAAVVRVIHFSKNSTADVLDKIMGSKGFSTTGPRGSSRRRRPGR